jgi:hypothetical protein
MDGTGLLLAVDDYYAAVVVLSANWFDLAAVATVQGLLKVRVEQVDEQEHEHDEEEVEVEVEPAEV